MQQSSGCRVNGALLLLLRWRRTAYVAAWPPASDVSNRSLCVQAARLHDIALLARAAGPGAAAAGGGAHSSKVADQNTGSYVTTKPSPSCVRGCVLSEQGPPPQRPLAARTISVAASLDHPTRFSYDPNASFDGGTKSLRTRCCFLLHCRSTSKRLVKMKKHIKLSLLPHVAAGGIPLQKREPGTLERRLRRALRLGLDAADARALLAVALVRLLVMPLASILVVKGGQRRRPGLSV